MKYTSHDLFNGTNFFSHKTILFPSDDTSLGDIGGDCLFPLLGVRHALCFQLIMTSGNCELHMNTIEAQSAKLCPTHFIFFSFLSILSNPCTLTHLNKPCMLTHHFILFLSLISVIGLRPYL